jgi:hypothetical protein
MHILLILAAILSIPFANANTNPLWDCTADATLQGDGDFFMRYGRDSWTGKAAITCHQDVTTYTKKVSITFNSSANGYGVNASSILIAHFAIQTTTPPNAFEFYAYVINHDPVAVIWHNESGAMSVDAKISSSDLTPGILSDLQQGNLFIR